MNMPMSIDDVIANYPDEWVLLDELESEDNLTVQRGVVVGHDSDREALELLAIERRLERCVIVCARLKDGQPAISRDYAVSPITSFSEIETVRAEAA